MTGIDSNITFENGQITKCVLQIGGKTFTVTLGNKGYEVVDGGTAPCSTPGSANAANAPGPANLGPTPGSAPTPGPTSGSTTAPSAPPQPSQEKEYNTQEDLIKTLGSYGYTSQ